MIDLVPEIQGWPDDNRPRLGFSKPKPPEPNKKLEKLQMSLLQKQYKESQQGFEMPTIPIPRPLPPPSPTPTSGSADAQEAASDARRQAGRRNGIASTILAGETGGYTSQALGGNPSIIG